MGSGLSMTSVNKIKELAETKEYSMAVDIIDSQDLTKSLNPQFLRLCGDVYSKCGRKADARRTLLMAHKIAPEAKRVMFGIIQLYLELGYKSLAEKYYEIYMFDAESTSVETKQLRYIYEKSKGMDYTIIDDYIVGDFEHTIDYDWSYEVILLFLMNNDKDRAKSLATEYIATFKESDNAIVVENLIAGKKEARDYYYIYPREEALDDDPEQEDIRELEKALLEADDLRIHPKEAEILFMEDDLESQYDTKAKKSKKKNKDSETETETGEAGDKTSDDSAGVDEAEEADSGEKKVGIFGKVLSKMKKRAQDEPDDNDEATENSDIPDEATLDEKSSEEENLYEKYNNNLSMNDSVPEKEFDISDIDAMVDSMETKSDGPVVSLDDEDGFEDSFDEDDEYANYEEQSDEESDEDAFVGGIHNVEVHVETEDDFVGFDNEVEESYEETAEETYEEYEEPVEETTYEEYEEPVEETTYEEYEEPVEETTYEEYEEPVEETTYEEYEEPVEEETYEEYEEPVEEATYEEYEESVEETTYEEYEEPIEKETYETTIEESYASYSEPEVEAEPEPEPEYDIWGGKVKKKKLDYPVFKTTLFPEVERDVVEYKNNFNEIMDEAQEKISENNLKEEQMLKEAEALLASLGIDLGGTSTTVNSSSGTVSSNGSTDYNNGTVGPSRDELKASLEIDSVKKDTLKKIKSFK